MRKQAPCKFEFSNVFKKFCLSGSYIGLKLGHGIVTTYLVSKTTKMLKQGLCGNSCDKHVVSCPVSCLQWTFGEWIRTLQFSEEHWNLQELSCPILRTKSIKATIECIYIDFSSKCGNCCNPHHQTIFCFSLASCLASFTLDGSSECYIQTKNAKIATCSRPIANSRLMRKNCFP